MKLTFVYPNKLPQNQALSLNASMRYRAYHPIRYLGCYHDAYCVELNQLLSHIKDFPTDKVIFIRPFYSQMLATCLDTLASLNIMAQADYDDLIFSPSIVETMPTSTQNRKKLYDDMMHYQQALQCFNAISCSTKTLAKAVLEAHPTSNTHVYRNVLAPEAGELSPTFHRPNKALSLYYLSGTLSHENDLAEVIPAIKQWLSVSNRHQLVLVGAIKLPKGLNPDQVKKIDHRHYLSLPQIFNNALAAIAPLENTPFNHCKSAIKYLETAHLGIPVICSAYGEYADIDTTLGPLIANTSVEWFDILMRLTTDVDFWQQESQRQKQGALIYGKAFNTDHFIVNHND